MKPIGVRNIIAAAKMLLLSSLIAGCVSVDLRTAAYKDVGSKVCKEYRQNLYTGNWWGRSPQECLDAQLQPRPEADINERGISTVFVTRTWLQTAEMIGSLGFSAPVHVTWWLEK